MTSRKAPSGAKEVSPASKGWESVEESCWSAVGAARFLRWPSTIAANFHASGLTMQKCLVSGHDFSCAEQASAYVNTIEKRPFPAAAGLRAAPAFGAERIES